MTGTAAYRVSGTTADRATVLCIEDDPIVQLMLDDIVGGAGGTCVIAGSAREAERHLAQEQYGLVVLDRRLPDSDGLLLLQNIKDSSNCPVIILSAMDDARDKLLGIGLGAADYLTKPFNPLELTSRIRHLLRMHSEHDADNGIFETAGLVFNPRTRQINSGGRSTILAPTESRLLQALWENADEVQTRDQLSRAVSGRDWTPGDRTIDVLINRLRRHLRNAPLEIRTVHRTGYFISLEQKTLS